MAEFTWGKQRLPFELHGRDVVLCDNTEQATQAAKAIAKAFDVSAISGGDDVRGTLRDRITKSSRDRIPEVLAALRLEDDALEWRLKDASPLRRVLSGVIAGILNGDQVVVVELGTFVAMPFDLAHIYRQLHAAHATFHTPIIAVIVDPALITSSGEFLTVLTDEGIVESGTVQAALADPRSEHLLARLEATPVPNPLAMQQRRVQRRGATSVNYSHTQILQLPTADAIALAGGDVAE